MTKSRGPRTEPPVRCMTLYEYDAQVTLISQ